MGDAVERRAILCILDFLRTATCPEGADPEAIGIAIDCLSTAYSLDATSDADLSRHGVQPGLLLRLLESGAQSQATAPGPSDEGKQEQGEKGPTGASGGPAESRLGDGGCDTDASNLGALGSGESRPPEGAVDTPVQPGAPHDATIGNGAKSSATAEAPEPKPSSSGEAQALNPGEAAASAVASGLAGSAAAAGSGGAVDVSAKLEEFLKGLESANYYDGTTPGSWEYLERQRQAKKIFYQCIEQQQQQEQQGRETVAGSAGAPPPSEAGKSQSKGKQPVQESSSDQQGSDKKAEADRLKTAGNAAMSEKRYSEAAALYTQAIALYENDAIFWANRAAAHLQLGNFEVALSDSQEAIQRDPTYSKAYSRLGHAYMGLQKYKEAIDLGFKKALELDSNNNSIKESMKAAKRKLDAQRGEEAREQEQWERQQQQQGSSFGFSFPSGGIPGFSSPSSSGNMFPPQGLGTPPFAGRPPQALNMQMPGVNLDFAANEGRPGGRLVIQSTNGNPLDPNQISSLLGMLRPARQGPY